MSDHCGEQKRVVVLLGLMQKCPLSLFALATTYMPDHKVLKPSFVTRLLLGIHSICQLWLLFTGSDPIKTAPRDCSMSTLLLYL
jgi:hypothetical protein